MMPTRQNHEINIGSEAIKASGIITVDSVKQTCWFCSDKGHIITTGHIFFNKSKNGILELKVQQGQYFDVIFEYQNIEGQAELIEKPYLDEKSHLDLAVLRLIKPVRDELHFLPLCTHENCLSEDSELTFVGLRQALGTDDLTKVQGNLSLEMRESGVTNRYQVTKKMASNVRGLSGAAACAICKKSNFISVMGIQSQQAKNAEEEMFVVPSVRLIEASPTLKRLYNPLLWTNREHRILLLRKLCHSIEAQETTWKSPDKHLSAVFREDSGPCVGPGVTCLGCKMCALAFLGEPNPKKLIELIERYNYTFILLYGSIATGKTKSSTSLYVASRRPPYKSDRDVRVVLVDVEENNLLGHTWDNIQKGLMTSSEEPSYAFLDAFLVELLRIAMERIQSPKGWFWKLSEDDRRRWCRSQIKSKLPIIGAKGNSVNGNLHLGLKAVLAGIEITEFNIRNENRLIIYLDNAHLIDEFITSEFTLQGSGKAHQPVNELLVQKRQQYISKKLRDGSDQILQNRYFIITTRHVEEIMSSTSVEALSSKVRALPIREVVDIDEYQILTCLKSRRAMWKVSGNWRDIAEYIQFLTNGHPWYVHNFLQFYDCILRNTDDINLMDATDIVASARFLWTHINPLSSREGCLSELKREISCLEKKKEYLPHTVDLNDLANNLIEQSREFSIEKITPMQPHSFLSQENSYTRPSLEDVAKILPAVQNGLIADRKEADEWRYVNMIVAMHFPVNPIEHNENIKHSTMPKESIS